MNVKNKETIERKLGSEKVNEAFKDALLKKKLIRTDVGKDK